MQKLAFAGAGLVVVWMMALGAVAYKRHADAEAATQAALQVQAAQQAAAQQMAAQKANAVAAAALPPAPKAAPAVAAVTSAAPEAAPASAPKATPSHRSHSSRSKTRTLAARSTTSSKVVATASPSAKRMKDDQLDALLKQFK